jgi:hypothetical protein
MERVKRKKVIYIAHPVSGDVKANIKKILTICREVHHDGEHLPVVPYLVALQYLNDGIREERLMGIEVNQECLRRGVADEMWLYGDKISEGMKEEIKIAQLLNIPVIPKTPGTRAEFEKFSAHEK